MANATIAPNPPATTVRTNSRVPYLLLALVILVFLVVRIRMLNIPLERDEGEYAYAGQLLLQGIPPYKLAYSMKLPGTYLAYAVIMAFLGQSTFGIHTGLLLVNAVSIVLVFFLARRVLDPLAAIVAAASYALLSSSPSVLGFAAHATHFVVFAALAGTLLLLRAINSSRKWELAVSGVLLGTAFLMKQPGIFLVIFAFLYLVTTQVKARTDRRDLYLRVGLFAGGATLPFLLICLWMWKAGVFSRFWFWTFTYGRLYGAMLSLREASDIFWDNTASVIGSAAGIWIAAAIGLAAIWWKHRSRNVLFLTGFLLFSFLGVCPGFYFREHYFILILPAVALLAGAAVSTATQILRHHTKYFRYAPVLLFLGAFGYAFSQQWDFWFKMGPTAASRAVYGGNPFPEAVQIAGFLKQNTPPPASIAVIGSEPEIYFYAGRHSATGYIYTYPLMEEQPYALAMQKEMIAEIEAVRPEFLVFINVPTSWLRHEHSQQLILGWTQKYIAEHYAVAGIVDILNQSQYRWGADAQSYRPVSPYNVQIFKRVSS